MNVAVVSTSKLTFTCAGRGISVGMPSDFLFLCHKFPTHMQICLLHHVTSGLVAAFSDTVIFSLCFVFFLANWCCSGLFSCLVTHVGFFPAVNHLLFSFFFFCFFFFFNFLKALKICKLEIFEFLRNYVL